MHHRYRKWCDKYLPAFKVINVHVSDAYNVWNKMIGIDHQGYLPTQSTNTLVYISIHAHALSVLQIKANQHGIPECLLFIM